MRIKRQRRKLRGKYSGNCLSCAAKWSKCWYIASVDNQAEWESRLNKPVTPAADEVCFQCWDAKIRTSPKRKLNYKSEIPIIAEIVSEDAMIGGYPLRPSKRMNRNKAPILDEDYASDADLCDSKGSSSADASEASEEEEEYYIDEADADVSSSSAPARMHKRESVILDEENAVLLLSTAFHSIPQDQDDESEGDININIHGGYHIREVACEDMTTRRNAYYCGSCGSMKKNHVCDALVSDQTPSPSSPVSPPSFMIPQHPSSSSSALPVFHPSSSVGIISALLAQPVGS